MPTRSRVIRHGRNRHPRPGLVNSPPTGVSIFDAFGANGSTNSTTCDLTNAVAAATGANTQFHDYTAGQASIGILVGSPTPTRLVIIWPDSQVRVGHVIGWDTPPSIMQAVQLPILEGVRHTIRAS
jgi:hypothetical protein